MAIVYGRISLYRRSKKLHFLRICLGISPFTFHYAIDLMLKNPLLENQSNIQATLPHKSQEHAVKRDANVASKHREHYRKLLQRYGI
jgi:hypothetical protein